MDARKIKSMTPQEIIQHYIKGTRRHAAYFEGVDIANHLSFHIDGYKPDTLKNIPDHAKDFMRLLGLSTDENPYFQKLIDERRPGETKKIQEHRRIIYSSITKEPFGKVINSLNKIVRSDDWKIDYSDSDTIDQKGENLEDYAEKNYPGFGSLTNWAYTFGLKKMLADPNGLIVTIPINFEAATNEFLKPVAIYVKSENVVFYEPGHMVAYKSSRVIDLQLGKQVIQVPVYVIISTEFIWETHQIDKDGNMGLDEKLKFTEPMFPVIQNGGVIDRLINNIPIYNSFLDPMLPSSDEAAREYSDMQAEVLLHIHSTLAVIQGDNCAKCKGTGQIPKEGGAITCGDCKGKGALSVNPYEQIVVRVRGIDKQQLPFPPAQYITKSTDIAKLQNERIKDHKFNALASVNMEFLAKTPLSESGVAKQVDKEELNNFVYSVAFHLVRNMLDPIYKFITNYRYALLIPNIDKRKELLPLIQVPEHFDLLTENNMIEQIKQAKEASIDPTIVKEMQVDYINKKFRDQTDVRKELIASIDVNPFPTSTTEEIIEMEMNRDITKEDAVTSIYASYFVQKLVEEDKKFLDLNFKQQLEKVRAMTNEKVKELKPEPVLIPVEPDGNTPTEPKGANGVS